MEASADVINLPHRDLVVKVDIFCGIYIIDSVLPNCACAPRWGKASTFPKAVTLVCFSYHTLRQCQIRILATVTSFPPPPPSPPFFNGDIDASPRVCHVLCCGNKRTRQKSTNDFF